ncbi:ABC transporter permease [Lutibacter sp. B1]|uniref:ABC transporter permease n=1 Tax=Lutibacter sp. B1 TaxID=2725996 RepID=UPI0014566C86|nr:ABC transporter permease [Lutibacter sp. B1]NLP56888.1 FtsX-like permease family protein [Lutibacter sp. B1]
MIFFKTYFRHLLKNKLYTTVTILGFAISLTFILLLSVYIKNELSVDNFQINKDRIYRIESENAPDFSGPIAVDLKNAYPDIEDFTRVYNQEGIITTLSDQKFKLNYLAVDASFFNIFSYPLISGTASEVLKTKNSIVLSESYARKLFGLLSPIGKKVAINDNNTFIVTGIIKDFPENTIFKNPNALINIKAMADITGFKEFLTEYGFCSMNIYFLEKENGNLISKTPQILENFKKDFWLYKEGYAKSLVFTPLKEVYFSSKLGDGVKSNNKTLIMVLSIIVLLILFLAVGNYVNLTVAQATFRSKEVAIKKLVGSTRNKIFIQFIKESLLLCFIAVLIAILFTKLAEPVFNSLLNTKLNLNNNITFINVILLIVFFSIIGIVSGILPALKISSFKPIEVVKGTFRKKSKGVYGNIFITFQYTVTIALLACSWIILKQTHFLQNYDVGFNKSNIILMPYLSDSDKKTTIKNALEQVPGVQEVSFTWGSPLDGGSNQSFEYNGQHLSFQEFRVDSSFFNLLGLKINPTEVAYSKEGIYLNKTALKILGLDPTQTAFQINDKKLPVLGIVDDFNFNDLSKYIGPLMIHQQLEDSYATNIFIKINNENRSETLQKIKSTYTSLIDNIPFEISFVDKIINKWYLKEEKTGKIIGYFTVLSLIISFLGLLAISTFYMQQRRKEISIRKVNGAKTIQILSLLNKNFLKWIGIAFIIAVPISWSLMSRWLENFAYKITLNWQIFVLAGLLTFLIALLTVSWQSFRFTTKKTIDYLRDE